MKSEPFRLIVMNRKSEPCPMIVMEQQSERELRDSDGREERTVIADSGARGE
jgi:hypothetical protein